MPESLVIGTALRDAEERPVLVGGGGVVLGARAAGLAVSTSIAFAARSREGVGGRGKEGLGESGSEGSRGGSRIGSWRGVYADP